jgi:hypothetical protein
MVRRLFMRGELYPSTARCRCNNDRGAQKTVRVTHTRIRYRRCDGGVRPIHGFAGGRASSTRHDRVRVRSLIQSLGWHVQAIASDSSLRSRAGRFWDAASSLATRSGSVQATLLGARAGVVVAGVAGVDAAPFSLAVTSGRGDQLAPAPRSRRALRVRHALVANAHGLPVLRKDLRRGCRAAAVVSLADRVATGRTSPGLRCARCRRCWCRSPRGCGDRYDRRDARRRSRAEIGLPRLRARRHGANEHEERTSLQGHGQRA